jgi:hypothetical protein
MLLLDNPEDALHIFHWRISRRSGDLCSSCRQEMKKDDRDRMDALFRMGCIVCLKEFGEYSEPEMHHLRDGRGMGHKKKHHETIPLCPQHHRLGPVGIGFHTDRTEWQVRHGTERDLLEEVNELL